MPVLQRRPATQPWNHILRRGLLATVSTAALALASAGSWAHLPPPIAGTTYSLVWSDEFNGTSIDTSKWNLVGPWGGKPVGSTGAFSYSASQVTEASGVVRITAQKSGNGWVGGILSTDTTRTFQYGYVEVRAKLPAGQGFWPAIWMYGDNNSLDELDIMEFLGGDITTVYQSYHFDPGGQDQVAPHNANWTADYHIFSMKWEPGHITYYVDYVQTGSWMDSIPSRAMYLMLNFDVGGGGDWGGAPNATTPSPAYVDIDYARIYQKPPTRQAAPRRPKPSP